MRKGEFMNSGWFYLHVNGDLIYKSAYTHNESDFSGSPFCKKYWPVDAKNKDDVWKVMIEALAAGARKERIKELSIKWHCTNEEAEKYAEKVGLDLGMDGDAFYARAKSPDFVDMQESPCGFGDSYLEAMADLHNQVGQLEG
jgi:hypothetical protein